MFTWRNILKNKTISFYYMNNIFSLLNHNRLKKELNKHNILLYFTLHPKLRFLKDKFKANKYIIYIKENDISNCLSKLIL